jgi:polar amino acid transport system substrate-binding protein
MFRPSLIVGLMLLSAAPVPAVAEQPALTILFHVRPPYAYYDAGHNVACLLAGPVDEAVARAGTSANWVEMPPARQTEEIKRSKEAICGLGWFKRPERETFALFTDPIYHDQPAIVVARQRDPRFADGMSLQDSFRDASRVLIVKTGYSYGSTIDEWIKLWHPTSSGSNEQLLGMIAQQRGDYVIMAMEEADDLLGSVTELGAALRPVRLSDAPNGELRYLMCSKATPAELIARIDAALPKLRAP